MYLIIENGPTSTYNTVWSNVQFNNYSFRLHVLTVPKYTGVYCICPLILDNDICDG